MNSCAPGVGRKAFDCMKLFVNRIPTVFTIRVLKKLRPSGPDYCLHFMSPVDRGVCTRLYSE